MLEVELTVNTFGDAGTAKIWRDESTGTDKDPDKAHGYFYRLYDGNGDQIAEGKVVHRYGDNAHRLLLKALLDAERHL